LENIILPSIFLVLVVKNRTFKDEVSIMNLIKIV